MSTIESRPWSAITPALPSTRDDQHGWGYVLLCATVASLFVRPADIVQSMKDWPIYQVLIVTCVVIGLRSLLRQFAWQQFTRNPMILCMGVLIVTAFTSHIWQGTLWEARNSAWNIIKLVILFLLVLALVNTKARLLTFARWQVLIICLMVGLALADHYRFFDVANIRALSEVVQDDESTTVVIERLRGTGIFEDPNDLGMVLVIGIILCVAFMTQPSTGWLRYLWLVPSGILLLALAHTYSRGAFLSLAASVPAWFYVRGGQRSAFLGSVTLLPLLVFLFSGRMTEVDSIFDGTGQSRIQIWSDALMAFRASPLFGMGEGRFAEEFGVVAHNSFLQTFAELGFLGGMAYFSLFVLGGISMLAKANDPTMEHMRGFIFAVLIGYGVGLMTLSRQFQGPTFLLLGLVAAVHNVSDTERFQSPRSKLELAFWCVVLSCLLLVGISILVRLLVTR